MEQAAEQCDLIGDGLVEFTAGTGAADTLLLCAAVSPPHDAALGLFALLRQPVVDGPGASGIPMGLFGAMRDEVAQAGLGTQAMCQAYMKQALVTLLRSHWLSVADGSLLTAAANHPRLARTVATIIERPGASHTLDSLAFFGRHEPCLILRSLLPDLRPEPDRVLTKDPIKGGRTSIGGHRSSGQSRRGKRRLCQLALLLSGIRKRIWDATDPLSRSADRTQMIA